MLLSDAVKRIIEPKFLKRDGHFNAVGGGKGIDLDH